MLRLVASRSRPAACRACQATAVSSGRVKRSYVSPSASRSAPAAAAQLREPEHDELPSFHYQNPTPEASSSTSSQHFASRHHPLQMPRPLPGDIPAPSDSPHHVLYPSTGVIDAISMISICLRRPELIPRAYQIFKQVLEDSRTGVRRIPEAELWSRVVEGVASLGKVGGNNWKIWRKRAETVVGQWESAHGRKGEPAGLEQGGEKVYQGWFAGLIQSQSPLTPMIPYLAHPDLPLSYLLAGLRPSDLPVAFDALLELSQRENLPQLGEIARQLQDSEKERRETQAREMVEEVHPVLESAGKALKRKPPNATESTAPDQIRFAVQNLRKALSSISSANVPINRQHSLELASLEAARAEIAHSAKLMEENRLTSVIESQVLQKEQLQSWMHSWLGALSAHLREDIESMRERQSSVQDSVYDRGLPTHTNTNGMAEYNLLLYLTLLPPEKLALITILEVMRMSGSGGIADGMKATRGMLAVAKGVEREYRAETIRSVAGIDSPLWLRTIDPQTQKPSPLLIQQVWEQVGKIGEGDTKRARNQRIGSHDAALEESLKAVWTPPWSELVHVAVGGYLLKALISAAKVTRSGIDPDTGAKTYEEQLAFSHELDYVHGKQLGLVRLNPVVAARLARDSTRIAIHPKHLPMLVPPNPWKGPEDGGYLLHRVPIMRFKKSAEHMLYLDEAAKQGHLEPVYHGLDVLSGTPWTINRKVFDIVLSAWNSEEAIADIPASREKSNYDIPIRPQKADEDPAARASYLQRVKAVLAQQRKDHAERCKFNYNIEIARSYLHDTFYLPHNMDFRGRAYPIPPHLSPVGDDLCRGLLQFGVKRPLGKTGMRWLQIHLANVYGYDKASFEERARFALDHQDDIFDSADNPLNGRRWWLKAEDPWQCLATCFDLAAALRSPDSEAYESSLPIHQDGTCNGMQHYAALGGDVKGARAVNLENGDRPADIYTRVADIVNKVIEEDRAAGLPVAQLFEGPVGRKVVKQTVMTTVYGVTFIGARAQIAKQLAARGDVAAEDLFSVSAYLARTVLKSIGDLFAGAKGIMEWLTTSARLIARSIPPERVHDATTPVQRKDASGVVQTTSRLNKELMSSVIWTTPLGLPVVQPYRKLAKKQVMTALQSVYITDPNAPAEVSPQKQASAFPPNFIHSLDATHMLLTAYKCAQSNITFASVHDSYWTHASSVESMSDLIRDQFVHLHSQDLIGGLRDEFLDRYGDHMIPIQSYQNIFKASEIKKSRLVSGAEIDEAMQDIGSTSAESVADVSEDDLSGEAEEDELDMSDVETLGGSSGHPEIIKVNKQKFVRFRDVLPLTPERGMFEVDRVRESAYFFS